MNKTINHSQSQCFSEQFNTWSDYSDRLCNYALKLEGTRYAPKCSPFNAKIRSTVLNDVLLSQMTHHSDETLDVIQLTRTPQHIAIDTQENYLLAYAVNPVSFTQDGIEKIIPPGNFALFSTDRSYTVKQRHHGKSTVITIPKKKLDSLDKIPEGKAACVISAQHGLGRILHGFNKDLFEASQQYTDEDISKKLSEQLISLTSLAFSKKNEESDEHIYSLNHTRYKMAIEFMENQATNPHLSASDVAAHLAISTGYLSRLLKINNTSFYEQLRTIRLRLISDALIQPHFLSFSITELAYRFGFNNASHFLPNIFTAVPNES